MATSKSQRIGIIIIAAVMVVGTIGSFFIMIVANENAQQDQIAQQEEYEKEMAKYEKQMQEMQKEQEAEAKKLSEKYYDEFVQYESLPSSFDASKVKKLQTEDLKEGSGKEITADTRYRAYYIGWNEEGKVFDGSIEDGALKLPIEGGEGLIEGWVKGVEGMKIGGVRTISIPGKMAYGQDQGADIKANAPLKFVVMAIPAAGDEE